LVVIVVVAVVLITEEARLGGCKGNGSEYEWVERTCDMTRWGLARCDRRETDIS
jgi:hypothetical protein